MEARFVLAELHHAAAAQDFEQQIAALRQQNEQLDDLLASRTRQHALERKRAEGAEALLARTQVIPHHETFSATIQPSYSSTKG